MTLYFIALVLPKELNEMILPLKHSMLERFGCRVGLKSPAHITLIPPFRMHPDQEEALRQTLVRIDPVASFTVRTAGFSAFRPRTIFVAVEENPALKELKDRVDRAFPATNEFGIRVDTRPFHPHITIATRDLEKKNFAQVWPEFESRPFDESWEVRSLSLLRHNGRTWDVVFEAPLADP